jgi:hypothetical protein
VPEQQPDTEPATLQAAPQAPSAGGAAPPADEHTPDVDKRAQALADLAGQVATVDRLKTDVYEQAKNRGLLAKPVRDPMTGSLTTLTQVITDAKAHLSQAVSA